MSITFYIDIMVYARRLGQVIFLIVVYFVAKYIWKATRKDGEKQKKILESEAQIKNGNSSKNNKTR